MVRTTTVSWPQGPLTGEPFSFFEGFTQTNPGFKYIFTMLADEEAKHYRAIEELQASGDLSLEKSTILGETRNTFEQLKADPNAKITKDVVLSKLSLPGCSRWCRSWTGSGSLKRQKKKSFPYQFDMLL